jgi:CheY-like chemotaxis protein
MAELRDSLLRVLDSGQDRSESAPTRTVISKVSSPPLPEGNSLRILLVEDNPVNQLVAMRLLQKRNHQVVVAKNGLEALDAFNRERFDLVFMDVQMPEMDGMEATARIRAQEKLTGSHQVIVALTAHGMKGDRERCLEGGMDDFITKPIIGEELYAMVRKYSETRIVAQAVPG